MKIISVRAYVLLLVFCWSSFGIAAEPLIPANSPYQLLAQVGTKLFNQIAALTPEQRKHPQLMQTIVQQQLMPYVDHRYAAFKILGSHIRHSTAEQREAFADAMYANLVRTYANALAQYNNQQVNFEPEQSVGASKVVTVRTEIVAAHAPTINIDFRLRKTNTGAWKAFDMVVEGISLLSAKQAEIASQIRQVGLQGIIDKLQKFTTA
jgi:phospholipid transport system substrate-binding protein